MILTDKNISDYMVSRRTKVDSERQKQMEKLNNLLHNTMGKKEYVLIVENKPVIASEPVKSEKPKPKVKSFVRKPKPVEPVKKTTVEPQLVKKKPLWSLKKTEVFKPESRITGTKEIKAGDLKYLNGGNYAFNWESSVFRGGFTGENKFAKTRMAVIKNELADIITEWNDKNCSKNSRVFECEKVENFVVYATEDAKVFKQKLSDREIVFTESPRKHITAFFFDTNKLFEKNWTNVKNLLDKNYIIKGAIGLPNAETEQVAMFADKKANKQFQNKLGDKMGKSKTKFTVIAYRWNDKVNGNTYHSVYVYNQSNEIVFEEKFAYGYDEQYKQTALEGLLKKGLIPKKYTDKLYLYERENNYPINWNVKNVPRKKDLALSDSKKTKGKKSTLKDDLPATIKQTQNSDGKIISKEKCGCTDKPAETPPVTKPEEKATIADKKKPKRKYNRGKKATMNDSTLDDNIFHSIKKAWNNDPIVKFFKK